MDHITDEAFDALITRAMDELPQEYITGLDNVAIVQADDPSSEQKEKMHLDNNHLLLGLYEGIPLPARGAGYTFVLPDKITLFKHPLLRISHDHASFFENTKRTLWHEMAHFYGLNHGDMDRLQQKNA
ncbi:metallopeptidase family protein [Candidatus Saccharibacteria bacterium]|nr:metallopeptidase family protein [Candidatus Saccharibacteria bacterium]